MYIYTLYINTYHICICIYTHKHAHILLHAQNTHITCIDMNGAKTNNF